MHQRRSQSSLLNNVADSQRRLLCHREKKTRLLDQLGIYNFMRTVLQVKTCAVNRTRRMFSWSLLRQKVIIFYCTHRSLSLEVYMHPDLCDHRHSHEPDCKCNPCDEPNVVLGDHNTNHCRIHSQDSDDHHICRNRRICQQQWRVLGFSTTCSWCWESTVAQSLNMYLKVMLDGWWCNGLNRNLCDAVKSNFSQKFFTTLSAIQ